MPFAGSSLRAQRWIKYTAFQDEDFSNRRRGKRTCPLLEALSEPKGG